MATRCLLYYITDRSQFRGNEVARRDALLAKIAEAVRAGVDYIQLREKDLSGRQMETLAREVVALIHGNVHENVRENLTATRVLINSRTDVALAAGADAVHLRADDIAPHEVRSVFDRVVTGLRPVQAGQSPATTQNVQGQFLVAASCHTVADVFDAESEKVDFAVFAPVFGKSSAPGTQPSGLAALQEACHAKIPVLALGGVNLGNAASCLNAGAAGIAGIRLFQENKIEDVVRRLRTF
jgi:thiamine-phosphate pyrophosphorylase